MTSNPFKAGDMAVMINDFAHVTRGMPYMVNGVEGDYCDIKNDNGDNRTFHFAHLEATTTTPKLWADMSETERNVLKAAHAAGHGIDVADLSDKIWSESARPLWLGRLAYRIAPSSQADTPTLWRDMSDVEKGALLLAAHDGAEIEVWVVDHHASWWGVKAVCYWRDDAAYRVKPKAPKVETVTDARQVWRSKNGSILADPGFCENSQTIANITHTYTITDGRVTACETVIHGEAE